MIKRYNENMKMFTQGCMYAEKIGRQYGNCKELQKLCKEAYQDAQKGFISKHDYQKIYVLCMSYAYPR